MISGRPWRDLVLDQACDAVRERYLRVAVSALWETRTDPEQRSLRVEYLAKTAAGWSKGIEALLAQDPNNPDLHLWLGRTLIEEAWKILSRRPVAGPAGRWLPGLHQGAPECPQATEDRVGVVPRRPRCRGVHAVARPRSGDGRRRQGDAVASRVRAVAEPLRRARGAGDQPVATVGRVAEEMFDFARVAMSMSGRDDPRAALIRWPISSTSFRNGPDHPGIVVLVQRGGDQGRRGGRPRLARRPPAASTHDRGAQPLRRGLPPRGRSPPARNHLARTYGRPSSLPWSYLGGSESDQYTKACRHLNILEH